MAFLETVLVVASLGLMPDGPVPAQIVQTTVVVPDGGTVLLGGLKSMPAQSPTVQPTVVVPDGVPAARVRETVRAAAGALLHRAEVFDVYRGAQVGEGRVSLALALEFAVAARGSERQELESLSQYSAQARLRRAWASSSG